MIWQDQATTRSPQWRRPGFTLVELIVVIAIIALLATIAAPSINRALQSAMTAKIRAHVGALANAAVLYKSDTDNRYYPGQQYASQLGTYTGSQVLAASIYGYGYADIGNSPTPKSEFGTYKAEYLSEISTRPETLSDLAGSPRAILYYPSRIGETGLSQYVFGDNSAYGNGAEIEANFTSDITDSRFGGAVNSGEFLLVAPGPNGTYFETTGNDDIKNW